MSETLYMRISTRERRGGGGGGEREKETRMKNEGEEEKKKGWEGVGGRKIPVPGNKSSGVKL